MGQRSKDTDGKLRAYTAKRPHCLLSYRSTLASPRRDIRMRIRKRAQTSRIKSGTMKMKSRSRLEAHQSSHHYEEQAIDCRRIRRARTHSQETTSASCLPRHPSDCHQPKPEHKGWKAALRSQSRVATTTSTNIKGAPKARGQTP